MTHLIPMLALVFSFAEAAPPKAAPAKPAAAAPAAAQAAPAWTCDLGAGSGGAVEFLAIGNPKALRVIGKGDPAKGVLEIAKSGKAGGTFTFELKTLDTSNSLRNTHMKDYLDVGAHPKAKLEITEMALPATFADGPSFSGSVPFKGNLTVKGKASPVEGVAKVDRQDKTVKTEAALNTTVTSHGIELPSFMGITVADKIDVTVRGECPLAAGK